MIAGLAAHQCYSSSRSYIYGWAVLLCVLGLLWLVVFDVGGPLLWGRETLLVGLGLIAGWRYGWQALHAARALVYRRIVFPRLRRAALAAGANDAAHVYVVVLSYRMSSELNAAVYSALVRDLQHYGRPATIVACVSDIGDTAQLESVARRAKGLRFVPLQQTKLGKRDAMERALDVLVRLHPVERSVVVLIDGDTLSGARHYSCLHSAAARHRRCRR